MISDALLNKRIVGLKRIIDTLASAATTTSSVGPAILELGREPKVKRKDGPRPGSQEWFKSLPAPRNDGVDMNDLLRAAERERKARRLPRSPEEARKSGGWHY
jgi:hypothetical protein